MLSQFSIRSWKCGPGWPLALLSSFLQVSGHAVLHLLLISSWGPAPHLSCSIHSYCHTSYPYSARPSQMCNNVMRGPLCPPSSGLVFHLSASDSLGSSGQAAMAASTTLCFNFGLWPAFLSPAPQTVWTFMAEKLFLRGWIWRVLIFLL